MGFLDLAKSGLQAYEASQQKEQRSRPTSPAPGNQDYNSGNQRPTGAAAEYYNEAPTASNQQYGGSHGSTGNDIYNNVDKNQAIQAAAQHSGDQDSSVFSSALSHLSSPAATPSSLDQKAVEDAHNEAYRHGNAANLDAGSMGSAAAMQARSQKA
ncbi:hypothetical protein FRB90_011857 [Tulasnella sp. 427]|nr:hypothetical protein FRB90_011857 [Tulasnella sp. 427]